MSSRASEAPSAGAGRGRLLALLAAAATLALIDPLIDEAARRVPSLSSPNTWTYHLHRVLVHGAEDTSTGRHVVLMGSSIVRTNLDEAMLAEALSRTEPVEVTNLGVDGSFCYSAVVVASALGQCRPDVVVWAVSRSTFAPDNRREMEMPYDSTVMHELGSGALYAAVPGAPGRLRAGSRDLVRGHWRLFAHRTCLRQYLIALAASTASRSSSRFGPYRSEIVAAKPDGLAEVRARLAAAAVRPHAAREQARQRAEAVRHIEETVSPVVAGIRASGAAPLIVWLPGGLDDEQPWEIERATLRRVCEACGAHYIDLHGAVSETGFNDSVHTHGDGKRETSRLLVPVLEAALARHSGEVR